MIDNNDTISGKQTKRSAWTRILDVALRAAHVLLISVLFGGAVFKIPVHQLLPWRFPAIASGIALIASEVFHNLHWPYQGRGVMVYMHVGLFVLYCFRPDLAIPCLSTALVIGMAGSHMPKKLRYWSFMHGRVK